VKKRLPDVERRRILAGLASATALGIAGRVRAQTREKNPTMLTRTIPKSAGGTEALPAIGMGTWQTFDVGGDAAARAPLVETLRVFFQAGARVIDSSPMYGRAESVVGDLLSGFPDARPFLATKVWTTGKEAGVRQMNQSFQRMRTKVMDLMQVHNLVDWRTHLDTLRGWKQEGRVRYLGVTHYSQGAFDELERIIAKEAIDFVQLPYSITWRDAERRLLPAARANGVAVLVMQPFETGALFRRVRGKSLPDWAAGLEIASWAQYFLKWILGHPAVTCPIPASADPRHMADDLRAGIGPLPDEATRRKMVEYLGV
jgi:diketogulonate reductase-like aldo/keto reductase